MDGEPGLGSEAEHVTLETCLAFRYATAFSSCSGEIRGTRSTMRRP